VHHRQVLVELEQLIGIQLQRQQLFLLYLEMDFSVIQQRVLLLVIYQQVQQVQ
jgi:hypothetical protein